MKFNISFSAAALLLVLCLGCLTLPVFSLDEVVSSHTLVLTLSDQSGAWPSSDDLLKSLEHNITNVLCSSLEIKTNSCQAFITALEGNALRLYITIQTGPLEGGDRIHRTLKSWLKKTATPLLDRLANVSSAVLGKRLPALTHIRGEYTKAPCNGNQTHSLLPVCAPGSVQFTTVYTQGGSEYIRHKILSERRGSNDFEVKAFIKNVFTGESVANSHRDLETVRSLAQSTHQSSSTRAPKGARDARGNPGSGRPTPAVSRATGGVVRARYLADIVFPDDNEDFPEPLNCSSSTGLWAVSLVAVGPLLLIIFRYAWYLGRQHAKKKERRLIVEDEKRLLNANTMLSRYDSAGGAVGATGSDPPPGRDSRELHEGMVWAMDENGNYYQTGAFPEPAPSEKGGLTGPIAAGDARRALNTAENVLPAGAEGTAAGALPGDENGAAPQQEGGLTHQDPNAAEAYSSHVYVDPQTGEIYQTYLDPNTGELYTQYAGKDEGNHQA